MEQCFCITLRQDVPGFNNITKVKEGSPGNLFYVRVKGQILVRNNSKVPPCRTGSQGNAIVRQFLPGALRSKDNNLSCV